MNARTLTATAGATLALIAAAVGTQAAGASSTSTNSWRSPSGNIACHYFPGLEAVQCQTDNDHYAVAVGRYGAKAIRVKYTYITGSAPKLAYGGNWTAPGILCASHTWGMRCRTSAGHGFTLAADDVDRW